MKLKDLIEDRLMISLRRFAKEAGVSRPTISNILNGSRKNPSTLTVKKICRYFNVDWKDYIEK